MKLITYCVFIFLFLKILFIWFILLICSFILRKDKIKNLIKCSLSFVFELKKS